MQEAHGIRLDETCTFQKSYTPYFLMNIPFNYIAGLWVQINTLRDLRLHWSTSTAFCWRIVFADIIQENKLFSTTYSSVFCYVFLLTKPILSMNISFPCSWFYISSRYLKHRSLTMLKRFSQQTDVMQKQVERIEIAERQAAGPFSAWKEAWSLRKVVAKLGCTFRRRYF